WDAAGAGDLTEPGGGRFRGAGEGVPVHGDQPERRVPAAPLVVVQCRPVQVAAHVHPVGDRGGQRLQRPGGVGDPLVVLGGGDAVLGDQHRYVPDHRAGAPDRFTHGWRVVLPAHLGALRLRCRGHDAVRADDRAGVGLHADDVVALGVLQVPVLVPVPVGGGTLLAAREVLHALVRDGPADSHAGV